LIISLVIVGVGQSSKPVQKILEDKKQESQKKCGDVVEGLRLCTTSSVVSVKIGESILIDLILQNVTEEAITIPMYGGFYTLYNVTVKDSDGNKILSRLESVKQKVQNKEANEGELLQFLPIGSNRHGFQKDLLSQEEMKIQFNLKDFYDFKEKGIYHVEISRKVGKDLFIQLVDFKDTNKIKEGSEIEPSGNNQSLKQNESKSVEIPLGTTIEVEIK